MADEKILKAAVLRHLEKVEKTNPEWALVLGKEKLSAAQVRERLQKDNKLWKEIREWAMSLAVDMFNEGSEKIESDSGKT